MHGTKDADHSLGFAITYATTEARDACVSHNRMAGVTTAQTRVEFLPPVRRAVVYEIEIPLDQHVGGDCGWRATAVSPDVVSTASRREPPKPGFTLFLLQPGVSTLARVALHAIGLSSRHGGAGGLFLPHRRRRRIDGARRRQPSRRAESRPRRVAAESRPASCGALSAPRGRRRLHRLIRG